MADIVFTHSYFYRFDHKQWEQIREPYPPLGTVWAASLMREEGYSVALHDTNFAFGAEELIPVLEKEKPRYLVIYDDGFNFLTKMCLTKMREAAFEMAKLGKKVGCKVLVCSSDSTDHTDKYLAEGVDYVIQGEGEQTLLESLRALEAGNTDLSEVPGLTYLQEGERVRTRPRSVMRDLDALPDPAWDLIDFSVYQDFWQNAHGYFALNLATTRGCPYKCNWCAKPIYGNRYNVRSPKRVVDEIAMLQEKTGVKYFWMCDDIFGLKPGWVQEFNQLSKERGLSFKYKIQSRVDLMLNDNQIDALAESGLDTVWVGAESGSQAILDAMDKGTKLEQIHQATAQLQKHGIKVAFFLQFGYLKETAEDIQKTLKLVKQAMPDQIGISVSYPLPGTKFYDKVKADLGLKQNWEDSDDLDLMFENTYPSAYYKRLQRYVHKLHRRWLAMQWLRQKGWQPWRLDKWQYRRVLGIPYYLVSGWVDEWNLRSLQRKAHAGGRV
ncbi:MAG: radical SAM protein [Bacteroidota bacterium]